VDVVAEGAEAAGRELVFCDNEPVSLGPDLGGVVDELAALAAERFAARGPAGDTPRGHAGDAATRPAASPGEVRDAR